jgi:hypothetical protein
MISFRNDLGNVRSVCEIYLKSKYMNTRLVSSQHIDNLVKAGAVANSIGLFIIDDASVSVIGKFNTGIFNWHREIQIWSIIVYHPLSSQWKQQFKN